MNAKKIMGAVLVALLAAALFVGAGAAADDKKDMGIVFVYQEVPDLAPGTWTSGANTLTVVAGNTAGTGYFSGANFVEGVYENATHKATVKFPTGTLSGVANTGTSSIDYMVIGGTYYKDDSLVLTGASAATVAGPVVNGLRVTYPDGSVITQGASWNVGTDQLVKLGKYTVQPLFNPAVGFVAGTPSDLLASKEVFTFTVAGAQDVTITSEAETVIESGVASVVVSAKPGSSHTLTADKFTFVSVNGYNAAGTGTVTAFSSGSVTFTMPNTGNAKVYVKAGNDIGTGKVKVTGQDASVSFTIVAGTISAKAEKDSYYIGDEVKITGTSTAGNTLYVYIEGTNVLLTQLTPNTVAKQINVEADGKWEVKLSYAELKGAKNKLDAGTYTIYISNKDMSTIMPVGWDRDVADLKTYTTLSLALKQPFISVTDAPAVAVKGTEYKVTGTAEATENLYAYIFGTNFFAAKTNKNPIDVKLPNDPSVVGTTLNDFVVSVDKNEFEVKFKVPKTGMAAGQYFMVIQHPMYDGNFNIWANYTKITTAATVGTSLDTNNKTVLFDVSDRQNANAAQALVDALETQNIDDMYVKLSFVVANAASSINPLPAEITKGSKLTVSGTTNLGEDKIVTVEILSTAFAAVPKESVGSASFIALTTKTDENGNWEVTFDTTGLDIDEYTVSATVEGFDPTTAKINVIEGAPVQPTETPVQPTETQQPTQPTETPVQTPGFGALAALAGLGAVAVLLLRRE